MVRGIYSLSDVCQVLRILPSICNLFQSILFLIYLMVISYMDNVGMTWWEGLHANVFFCKGVDGYDLKRMGKCWWNLESRNLSSVWGWELNSLGTFKWLLYSLSLNRYICTYENINVCIYERKHCIWKDLVLSLENVSLLSKRTKANWPRSARWNTASL